MPESNKPIIKKKQLNTYARFSGIAIQMGVTIAGGVWTGSWLDQRYEVYPQLFTIIFSLVSVFAALFLVIREVMRIK